MKIKSIIIYSLGVLIGLFLIKEIINYRYIKWKYSEEKVTENLIQHFNENKEQIGELMEFSSKLSKRIIWNRIPVFFDSHEFDSIAESITERSNTYQEITFIQSDHQGISQDEMQGFIIWFPEENRFNESLSIRNLNKIGLEKSDLDFIIDGLRDWEWDSFIIKKDGSVVTQHFIGPSLFELVEYQYIYPGENLAKYENLIPLDNDIFLK